MAWVRYDDQLNLNAKVTAALLEDPGVMSLHLMANTWTNAQKHHPGYIPATQLGALLFDRSVAMKWAEILVRHGLWHERGQECDRCREFYAGYTDAPGYVIHDAKDYRPPARERQTPGTPAEISAARAAAGRKGGKSTASRREQNQQTARATAASGASKTSKPPSNGVSPVPEPVVASNEATLFQPSAAAAPPAPPAPALSVTQRSKRITDEYSAVQPMCKWPAVNGVVIKAIKAERWSDDEIQAAVLRLAGDGRSMTVETLRIELDGLPPSRASPSNGVYRNPTNQDEYDDWPDRRKTA